MATPRSLIKLMAANHEFWYRLSGGVLGGRVLGMPVLLLTTTGRKSGRTRTTPLTYLDEPEGPIIVASNGGNPTHPGWYHNLRADPNAEVQVGRETRRVVAEVLSDDERARVWPKITSMYRGYANYQKETSRRIPLVRLRTAGGPPGPPA